MSGFQRRLAIVFMVAAVAVATTGVAVAGVSDGNYRPSRQHCTGHADDSDAPGRVEPDCHSFIVSANDGAGHEAASAGTQQTADGNNASQVLTNTTPSPLFDPTTGLGLYLGADDNLDSGEHDSSEFIGDGPSDSGAVVANVTPDTIASWLLAAQTGDTQYLLTHPLPLLEAGFGSCADGICESVQTQRHVAYQGGGDGQRSVYDYDGVTFDPESCGGPSDSPTDCPDENGDPQGILYWHNKSGTVYVDPGVQVYEDPNPEGSPIGPYPLPALYVGTCGIVVGGGPVVLPASPLTNSAGQLAIKTGC